VRRRLKKRIKGGLSNPVLGTGHQGAECGGTLPAFRRSARSGETREKEGTKKEGPYSPCKCYKLETCSILAIERPLQEGSLKSAPRRGSSKETRRKNRQGGRINRVTVVAAVVTDP